MKSPGFTLIELMIVMAIIGILASIASQQFGAMLIKTRQGMTKGNLATIRSAITLFHAETGQPPTDNLASLISAGHLKKMPMKDTTPFHDPGNSVSAGPASAMAASTGDWFYFNAFNEPNFGRVVVNCIHSDLKGKPWSTF